MFRVTTNIDSIEKIDKQIKYVNSMLKMKEDIEFQSFIKDKCMQTLESVMNSRLQIGMTTNDDSIVLYRNSNHIEDTEDGFVIYNNAKIPANVFGKQNNIANYPNGQFSIALAFEYGVGVVGIGTGNPKAWEYNVNSYENGWYLPKNVLGKSGMKYEGYQGFEIYRYTADEIQKNLSNWVREYMSKGDK